jgi:hypothetical protein
LIEGVHGGWTFKDNVIAAAINFSTIRSEEFLINSKLCNCDKNCNEQAVRRLCWILGKYSSKKPLSITKSREGKPIANLDQYQFRINYQNKKNIYWRCRIDGKSCKCPAKIITDKNFILKANKKITHTH